MKTKSRHSGISLTETVVVVASVAILAVFGTPAINALLKSFESVGGTRSMISAALASARAIAAKEQRYAGIRFQQDLKGHQYIIFIVHDFDKTGLAPGFRAVEGIEPIKLPDSVGVMDLMVRTDPGNAKKTDCESIEVGDLDGASNLDPYGYGKNIYIMDTTSFSIVFSPSGKLVVHDVRVRNKDGVPKPANPHESMDYIFNSIDNINQYKVGMFIQDDYAELGLGAEPSRSKFVIYDKSEFENMDKDERWNYLQELSDNEMIHINAYTGTIIEK